MFYHIYPLLGGLLENPTEIFFKVILGGWLTAEGLAQTAQTLDFHYFTRHTQQRDVSPNDVSFATLLVYPNKNSQVLGGKFQNQKSLTKNSTKN